MKKCVFIFTIICILFAGCKKTDDKPNSGEDLSYLIMTYRCYTVNDHTYKTTWTYDGHKPMGNQYYVDGQLTWEYKNYSYNGLIASWDSYSYQNNEVTKYSHYETEYLDETFLRTKHQKVQVFNPDNPQNNYIEETFYEYDGKKEIGCKLYRNDILQIESHCNYDGLRCTYTITDYYYDSIIWQVRNYEIVYLDDTYLREKSKWRTIERYDTEGNLTYSRAYYTVNEYDGKKPIGYQFFYDGKLGDKGRDYQYDGLTCFYFVDSYQDGEVTSTQIYEVEYLE